MATLDLDSLISKLVLGWRQAAHPIARDVHWLDFRPQIVVCHREWDYDDQDMSRDDGYSKAIIRRPAVRDLLDEVLAQGQATRIFSSVNSYHSHEQTDNGLYNDIHHDTYYGKTSLTITIQGDSVALKFLPSVPASPTVRLCKGRDYL